MALSTEPVGAVGENTLTFSFDIENDGSIDAQDVRALLSMPIDTRVETLACTLNGQPCEATITPGAIDGVFTIASGSTLRVSGLLAVLSSTESTSTLWASAFAPYGFVERDLKDNVASAPYADVILRTGFE